MRPHAQSAYERNQGRRLTLSEEQLSVGTRDVSAGEVNVHKVVDTRRVQQQVGLTHDEVTIERVPLGPDATDPDGISESTLRIPLTREEAVVEKRVVGLEEVTVGTKQVTEQQTVQADLRKERLVTEGLDAQTGTSARTPANGSKKRR